MPTTTINWPEGLGCSALQDGYSLKPVSNILRTSLSDGRAFQRRKYMSTPMTVSVSWLFTEKQYIFFDNWFYSVLGDGISWFNMPLKTSDGYTDHICRFTDTYSEATIQQGRFWKVSATLEIFKRPGTSTEYAEYTPDILLNLDIFDIALNREWPAA
ncbi:MAG: hypothetical protein [Bacteriophage sp.]|nr:MAG: hypothetical protein [Bacteriophage sp.]